LESVSLSFRDTATYSLKLFIKTAAKPLLMETWLLLTDYRKSPLQRPIRWYHRQPPTTYRLDTIPKRLTTIVRYDTSRSSKVSDFYVI